MLQDVHVICFYAQRTDENKQFLFLEYAAGGELFDRIGRSIVIIIIIIIVVTTITSTIILIIIIKTTLLPLLFAITCCSSICSNNHIDNIN